MLKLAANYSLSINRPRENYNFNNFMTDNDIGNVIEIRFEESSPTHRHVEGESIFHAKTLPYHLS